MRNLFIFLFAIAILLVIIFLFYLGFGFIKDQYQIIDEGSIALFWLFAILLVACTLIISAAIRTVATTGDSPVHPDKAEVYNALIEYLDSTTKEGKSKNDFPLKWRHAMVLWAGSDVLKRFIAWHRQAGKPSDSEAFNRQTERLIFEIRRELGHKQEHFGKGAILNLLQDNTNRTAIK